MVACRQGERAIRRERCARGARGAELQVTRGNVTTGRHGICFLRLWTEGFGSFDEDMRTCTPNPSSVPSERTVYSSWMTVMTPLGLWPHFCNRVGTRSMWLTPGVG